MKPMVSTNREAQKRLNSVETPKSSDCRVKVSERQIPAPPQGTSLTCWRGWKAVP